MKLPSANKPTKVFSSSSQETKECFFSKGKTNQRNLIVSNYSNPEQAVIRELTANARDAHIAAKQTKPIELTITNKSRDRYSATQGINFSIRDYGKGVTKKYLDKQWCEIGFSTKSNSNNQVGAFGIGRMTPFCLAESFTVTTYQNGKAHIYIMSENSNGVFQNTFFGTRDTTEPNGMKIEFSSKRGRVVPELFEQIQFLDVPIDIRLDNQVYETKKLSDYDWTGPNFALHRHQKFILYGGIAYRCPYYYRYSSNSLDSIPFILNIPLGELEIASSRESISRTNENKSVINKYTQKAANHLRSNIQKEINACKTPKEAYIMHDNLDSYFKKAGSYHYNGKLISNRTKNAYRSYSMQGDTCYKNGISHFWINPKRTAAIVLDSEKYSDRNYIKGAGLTGEIVVSSSYTAKELADDLWIDEKDVLKSSDLNDQTKQYLKEKRQAANKNATPSISHSRYFSYSGNFNSYYMKNLITPVKTPEKYLVVMDKYRIQDQTLLRSYVNLESPPAYSVVRQSIASKLLATGKHELLTDRAKKVVEKMTKSIIPHVKRKRFYANHKKLFDFLRDECGWKRLDGIIQKLKKSSEICANNKNLVSLLGQVKSDKYSTEPDLGMLELINLYRPDTLTEKQKEDLRTLYKAKYEKVSK